MSHMKQLEEQDSFLKALAEELLAMPESEILEGEDVAALQNEKENMIAMAKLSAGRRRLAAGRLGYEASQQGSKVKQEEVSIAMARQVIEAAMNDSQFTLAARSLGEMSDEDVRRIYKQITQLQSKQDK
ncbi:MAG: hypothetical protein HY306_04050 [Nitrosomonadales bacterium]|nr:hypothetical protein [Nitrosomonadales bacterium]